MKFKIDTNTIVIITLIIGVCIGYYLSISLHSHENESHTIENHDHNENMESHSHSHSIINTSIPSGVSFEINKDSKSGYNLQIITQNFTFTPENVNTQHIEGQGHAHVYINGVKQRIYSNWVHIPHLKKGENEITVTLNGNDHSELMYKNEKIEATKTITVE